MYIESVEIESIGPIDHVHLKFPLTDDGRPKPIVVVGENGSGKSILLAHLVNTLLVGKQEVFEDVEVEKGKVYKYRSPTYITSGRDYSYSSVKFQNGIEVKECQLRLQKDAFEKTLGYTPARKIWTQIPNDDSSVFSANFQAQRSGTSQLFKEQCCLYFPVNRFEEPGWLNIDNLLTRSNYSELKAVSGYSNRSIISISPLKSNRDWLLDLIFDRQLFDIKTHQIQLPLAAEQPPVAVPVFAGFSGQSATIYEAVLAILRVILREGGNIRLGAGARKQRQISVMKDEAVWVPNLFQLSTGEVLLLNLFLSILRDYDLSDGSFKSLQDIKGIVVIDEIDAHLHTSHQRDVLPELIVSFPNVQFIITTHSPLFLLGMESKFGTQGFCVFNMPNGEQVVPDDFSEFNAAYESFKETARHREEIRRALEKNAKPIVFVEGDYDVRYLKKAAEVLGKQETLERVQLKDSDGYGNLDKLWKSFDNQIADIVPSKIILLYDCDISRPESTRGRVVRRVIPTVPGNPIAVGIENLFSPDTIGKVEAQDSRFIDTEAATEKRVRGEITIAPAKKSVNRNEKGKMCTWLCEQGTPDDFQGFQVVFEMIDRLIAE